MANKAAQTVEGTLEVLVGDELHGVTVRRLLFSDGTYEDQLDLRYLRDRFYIAVDKLLADIAEAQTKASRLTGQKDDAHR